MKPFRWAEITQKSRECATFEKRTTPYHGVLRYHAIWCSRLLCSVKNILTLQQIAKGVRFDRIECDFPRPHSGVNRPSGQCAFKQLSPEQVQLLNISIPNHNSKFLIFYLLVLVIMVISGGELKLISI